VHVSDRDIHKLNINSK